VSQEQELTGPDLTQGVAISELKDGAPVAGQAFGNAVLIVRRGDEVFAVGATCTHYSGPLAEGIVVGDTVRCPWHHACFSLRTGEAIRAPALNPIARYAVEVRNGRAFVISEMTAAPPAIRLANHPNAIVIVGAGAAGDAAADMLRRRGYTGRLTMIGADADAPYDRPNISKNYLAGDAPEEWIPLRPASFYQDNNIELLTSRSVTALDTQAKRVTLDDGAGIDFDKLLIATGAAPVRLPASVDKGGRVMYLRTLADSRAIIARAESARVAVVIGASFIGLEVAASLRARGLEVHVVAPEANPLERVMGPQLGQMIRDLHESKGVTFHLGRTAATIEEGHVVLDNGERITCDVVIAGIGVRPNDQLAKDAGLRVNNGIEVNAQMETEVAGIYAAGDVARFPDARTGGRIRVEHWVVAQRQGQVAACSMLGVNTQFDSAPFFWSAHYDLQISYVGHAEKWDEIVVDGSVEQHDCEVSFRSAGRTLAVATVGRDQASLRAEVAMESEKGIS